MEVSAALSISGAHVCCRSTTVMSKKGIRGRNRAVEHDQLCSVFAQMWMDLGLFAGSCKPDAAGVSEPSQSSANQRPVLREMDRYQILRRQLRTTGVAGKGGRRRATR